MFSNTNFIAIQSDLYPPTPAAPYPAGISVDGLAGQIVTKATVTLNNISHASPSDVSILLVNPQGQSTVLMAEAGSQYAWPVTNLTLTLDDGAPTFLPVDTVAQSLMSGTYKPTNGYLILGYPSLPFDFPAPAPPGNSNSVSALSIFKNTDPDGTWNLFVVDDSYPYSGCISNGWALTLSVAVPLQINQNGTNVILSWPQSATNYTLQFSLSLSGGAAWSNVLTAPVSGSGRFHVTNSISNIRTFYRLEKP